MVSVGLVLARDIVPLGQGTTPFGRKYARSLSPALHIFPVNNKWSERREDALQHGALEGVLHGEDLRNRLHGSVQANKHQDCLWTGGYKI